MFSERIEADIHKLEAWKTEILERTATALNADGGKMYNVDLLMLGASKRTIQTLSGFISLIRARNVMIAGALLRMQLDSAMRFGACWLVDNPDDFAMRILGGARFDTLKSATGERLTDRYLVDCFSAQPDNTWIRPVYDETCGFVHLSGRHVYSAMISINEAERGIQFWVGEDDQAARESDLHEAIAAFSRATAFYCTLLVGWHTMKEKHSMK